MRYSTTPGTFEHNIELVRDMQQRLAQVKDYLTGITDDSYQAQTQRDDCAKLISVFEHDIKAHGGTPK